MTLGQRIQKLRKGAGLTQEQLAERMGVTRQAVSKWESDGGVPELDTLIAMSRLFHVTIGQLLGVEELRKSGVGSGEDGGQTQVGTGLHEAQVEAILRRYVEATRAQRQAPPSMYGKYGWKAPLLAVAGLAALMVLLGLFMNHVNSTIGNMRATLSNLQTTVWDWEYEISNIQSDIRQMQEEQNSLFSSLDSAVTGFDPEGETVEVELAAVLKTYTPGTQLQFVLAWVWADGTAGETASQWINGPEFRARLELSMNVEVDADLRLRSADGTIQQQDLVLDLPGLSAEDFQLSAGSLSGLYSIAVGMSGSATAENPVVVSYGKRVAGPGPVEPGAPGQAGGVNVPGGVVGVLYQHLFRPGGQGPPAGGGHLPGHLLLDGGIVSGGRPLGFRPGDHTAGALHIGT